MATDKQLEYIYRLFDRLGITSVTTALHERGFRHASMVEDLGVDEASDLIDGLKADLAERRHR